MNNYNNLIYNDDYNRINDITKNKKGINNQINENEIISNYKLVNIDSRNRLKTSKYYKVKQLLVVIHFVL